MSIVHRRHSLAFGLIAVAPIAVTLIAGAQATRSTATPDSAKAPASFAIVDTRIVDGTGKPPFEGTIVVRDGRIAAVGRNVAVPAGLRTIDGRGRTVTPGLFDLHVHLLARAGHLLATDVAKHLAAYLYCGVTSVAELGSDPESFEPFRRMLADGTLRGPHVSFAARMAVPGGHGAEAGRADLHTALVVTERDAHAAVRRIAAYQPELIKVFADGWRYGTDANLPSMEEGTLSAIATDARARRLPVFTHTVTVEGAREAAEAGVTVLAHGIGDAPADEALVRLMRDRGMTYVSTLAVYEPRDHRRTTALLWKVVEPAMRERLGGPARTSAGDATTAVAASTRANAAPDAASAAGASGGGSRIDEAIVRARARRWGNLQQNVKALSAAGVRLGVGTDAGMPSAPHGWSALLELRLLVEAGLTPLDALTAATGHSAQALGVAADRGTIAPGLRADLVLVDGDPIADIAQMERIARVFIDGREIDRAALEAAMTSDTPTPLAPVVVTDPLIDDFEDASADRPDGPRAGTVSNGANDTARSAARSATEASVGSAGSGGTPVTADAGGRSDRGSRWMNASDPGPHTSRVVYGRVRRSAVDHALQMSARMSDAASPFARVWLSMVRGGLQPADVSRFRGLRFDARGEGAYRLVLTTRGVRDGRFHDATFQATPDWTPVEIAFDRLTQPGKGASSAWIGTDLLEIAFELTREPGTTGWLELDNLRLQ